VLATSPAKDVGTIRNSHLGAQHVPEQGKGLKIVTPAGTFGGEHQALSTLVTPGSDRNPYCSMQGWHYEKSAPSWLQTQGHVHASGEKASACPSYQLVKTIRARAE
jgi:hypothetical protein